MVVTGEKLGAVVGRRSNVPYFAIFVVTNAFSDRVGIIVVLDEMDLQN